MKVIAHIARTEVLVQMSRHELARLAGLYGEHALPYLGGASGEKLPIGTTIAIDKMYDRLRSQEQVAGQLDQMAKSLRGLAELVESVRPTAAFLTEEPKEGA